MLFTNGCLNKEPPNASQRWGVLYATSVAAITLQ